MAYFITLEVITILLAFLIRLAVFYFVIKIFNRIVTISRALKPILLYELGFFIFWIIDPFRLFHFFSYAPRALISPLYLLASVAILF